MNEKISPTQALTICKLITLFVYLFELTREIIEKLVYRIT